MDKQVMEAERLGREYIEVWWLMKDDLLSRQGNIKTFSDKEHALNKSRGDKKEIDLILREIQQAEEARNDTSSGYFKSLQVIINAVPLGYEKYFWEVVSPSKK